MALLIDRLRFWNLLTWNVFDLAVWKGFMAGLHGYYQLPVSLKQVFTNFFSEQRYFCRIFHTSLSISLNTMRFLGCCSVFDTTVNVVYRPFNLAFWDRICFQQHWAGRGYRDPSWHFLIFIFNKTIRCLLFMALSNTIYDIAFQNFVNFWDYLLSQIQISGCTVPKLRMSSWETLRSFWNSLMENIRCNGF